MRSKGQKSKERRVFQKGRLCANVLLNCHDTASLEQMIYRKAGQNGVVKRLSIQIHQLSTCTHMFFAVLYMIAKT